MVRQNLVGQVIGTAMRKTVKVRVERLKTIPKIDKVTFVLIKMNSAMLITR